MCIRDRYSSGESEVYAVNDATMAVEQGEFVSLLGPSGSGKTTMLEALIPFFVARGLRVSMIKHTHHDFDIDRPGKDSWRLREAGCTEVMRLSNRRWALMHEMRGAGHHQQQQRQQGFGQAAPGKGCDDQVVKAQQHDQQRGAKEPGLRRLRIASLQRRRHEGPVGQHSPEQAHQQQQGLGPRDPGQPRAGRGRGKGLWSRYPHPRGRKGEPAARPPSPELARSSTDANATVAVPREQTQQPVTVPKGQSLTQLEASGLLSGVMFPEVQARVPLSLIHISEPTTPD